LINTDFNSSYNRHAADLEQRLGTDAGLRAAVGGEFIAVGKLEYYLLRSLGLADGNHVVDVGCGSGRLACQLASFPAIQYTGTDVVQRLLSYAEKLSKRPDWHFIHVGGTSIPCVDASADFICFFSVFTHLLHEDTFKYFREARRCLKPDGLLVMSFLEFTDPNHWNIFMASVDGAKSGQHLNQFVERGAISAWAEHSDLEIVDIRGDSLHIPLPEEIQFENGVRMGNFGSFGQSIAILRRKREIPAISS
jgi:SAM-dependent methyltransferase